MESQSTQFKIGQLVWAKLYGHSWLPAIVGGINKTQSNSLLIRFIADETNSWLEPCQVMDYKTNQDLGNNTKRRGTISAIWAADRIAGGQSTFEEERARIRHTLNVQSAIKIGGQPKDSYSCTLDDKSIKKPNRLVKGKVVRVFNNIRTRSRSKSNGNPVPVKEGIIGYRPAEAQSDTPLQRESKLKRYDFMIQNPNCATELNLKSDKSLSSRFSDLGSIPQRLPSKSNLRDIQRTLMEYIEDLISKLAQIRNKSSKISKERVYSDLSGFVGNCEKLDLDFDLLVGSKLAKYLHLAYLLLLEINDSSSIGYRLVLPRLSNLRERCKKLITNFFSTGELNQVAMHSSMEVEKESTVSSGNFTDKINFLIKNKPSPTTQKQSVVVVIDEEEPSKNSTTFMATSAGRIEQRIPKLSQPSLNNKMSLELPVVKELSLYSGKSNLSKQSSISQLNFSSNLSTYSNVPPVIKKNEKGKYVKEEHIVKTIFRRQRSGCPSRVSSNRDYPPSKLSDSSSLRNFPFPNRGNKEMNMMELIQVKREETEMSGIRKRVCRKIYTILCDELKVGRIMAKRLTLGLEARINHFYSHNYDPKLYIKIVKLLFKKVRTGIITVKELIRVTKLSIPNFEYFLNQFLSSPNLN